MDTSLLPILLGVAVLLPLASFFTLLMIGRWLPQSWSGYIATTAIVTAGLLSFWSLSIWLFNHAPEAGSHQTAEHVASGQMPSVHARLVAQHDQPDGPAPATIPGQEPSPEVASHSPEAASHSPEAASQSPEAEHTSAEHGGKKHAYTDDYYLLGQFGRLRLTISYYIDSLTLVMFCVVSIIASCIHFYSMGYMHEEEGVFTDPEVTMKDGSLLKRPGRYWVFFMYLSLFCFSMLGLLLAGNVAMVFVFWELVGICSYFLIGFYVERKSASNAANKAFIVNRIGDFGMIIGLMALWTGLGTLAFGDVDASGNGTIEKAEQGIFTQVRSEESGYCLATPIGMVRQSARGEVGKWARQHPEAAVNGDTAELDKRLRQLQSERISDGKTPYGYWLLIIAGVGIFCGCVGKSAQFPLHVWLPDAMEGPTPVSALVHSATMVAAGVYLVGRFYPVFTPEVLFVIAIIGVFTLFMAATIAITATDIKRVLAYSTISQLGYMMMALGLGGWLAGMLHLVTHAFFKSLLLMCSGSVIHAVHTNEMPEMGGLRKKMPYTAYTMLVGCLAISGVCLPFLIGFSGYYSKDMILEQAFSFRGANAGWLGSLFFVTATGGAAITAFYMFRLWFMTFAGSPRNEHRYSHAYESPKTIYVPLVILAVFATAVAWHIPFVSVSLQGLLEQARPTGTAATVTSSMLGMTWPNEHIAHLDSQWWTIKFPVTMLATGTALGGILLAAVLYGFGVVNPDDVRRRFNLIYRFLINKWWFDELYDVLFVKPLHQISHVVSRIDQRWIDGLIDGLAWSVRWFARTWERVVDQGLVDGVVNVVGRWTYSIGASLRVVQTGSLRQYVMFLAIALIAIFLIVSFFWSPTLAF